MGEGGKNKNEGYGSGDGSETGKWQEKEKINDKYRCLNKFFQIGPDLH